MAADFMPPEPPTSPLPPAMRQFVEHLDLRGRRLTADNRGRALRDLARWLGERGAPDPLAATPALLAAYQEHLATAPVGRGGRALGRRSQANRIEGIRAFYRWCEARSLVVADPSRRLRLRVPRSRVVVRNPLTIQEVTALLQAQAAAVAARREGTHRWATEFRNLAMLVVAVANGRRRSGIAALRVEDIDRERREVRVDREKGRAGRVLPTAGWAMDVLAQYLDAARPVLARDPRAPWVFLDRGGTEAMSETMMWHALQAAVRRAVEANPDLDELPGKRVTWHSLRVSFAASLLFPNGCDIRTLADLLLHRLLSTTAAYTPIPVEDMRQVFRRAHPRA